MFSARLQEVKLIDPDLADRAISSLCELHANMPVLGCQRTQALGDRGFGRLVIADVACFSGHQIRP